MNYLDYYNLEDYLFNTVKKRFDQNGKLDSFDFMCIVIWKSNRAKSTIAKRLRKKHSHLDDAVRVLTSAIYLAPLHEKLRIMIDDWGFRLPMATAILTVLYPDDFTIYDVRLCEELRDFHNLSNRTKWKSMSDDYNRFVASVKSIAPKDLTLRNKDRYLWARSFVEQLKSDIKKWDV